MPKNKSAFVRYRTIDRCLRNTMHPYPDKEYLRDKCEYELFGEVTGNKISISSIEKDLDAMRRDASLKFFAPIKYHKIREGYYYDEPDFSIEQLPLSPQEEDALKFASLTLFQYRNISIFEHFKEAIDKIYARLSLANSPADPKIDQYVHFERSASSSALRWLQPLYHAISNDHAVEFDYDNVYKKEHKHFVLQPYLLKENRRRWYVLGWYQKHETYLTFALDRITNLRQIDTHVKKRDDFDPEKIFRHSTGIMGNNAGELIDLVIEVTGPLSKLLELNPIHDTQEILEQLPDGIQVRMQVINSPELKGQLLSFGKNLEVLQPAELRDELIGEAKCMLENYSGN